MAFKMKGSAFKLGGVQGTSGHASALKQKEDSALQCRMYNKANNFTMKSPLEQSCPPGTEEVMVDEEGNPIQMKSAFKQYDREEKEGFTYEPEVVTVNPDGTTTYTKKGTKPGSKGGRSGDPVRSKLMSEAIARGDDTFEYKGRTYTTDRSTDPELDEMSYTTGPTKEDIEPLSLDPIIPSLAQDVSIEPTTSDFDFEIPETEEKRIKREKKDAKILKKREKQRKKNLKEAEKRGIIPKTPKYKRSRNKKRNIFTSGYKRKKAARALGDFLNPFNDGGGFIAPACRTTRKGR